MFRSCHLVAKGKMVCVCQRPRLQKKYRKPNLLRYIYAPHVSVYVYGSRSGSPLFAGLSIGAALFVAVQAANQHHLGQIRGFSTRSLKLAIWFPSATNPL